MPATRALFAGWALRTIANAAAGRPNILKTKPPPRIAAAWSPAKKRLRTPCTTSPVFGLT